MQTMHTITYLNKLKSMIMISFLRQHKLSAFAGFLQVFLLLSLVNSGCKGDQNAATNPDESQSVAEDLTSITRHPFGKTSDGEAVELFKMSNASGTTVEVITYGGIITSLSVPDKTGSFANVVLGYDSLSQYIANNPYFGAIIGRYGNRIAKGKFSLDGQNYQLETNDGPNHLHGGVQGFDKVVWEPTVVEVSDGVALALNYTSPDGAGGYPGKLSSTVTYTLTNDDELVFDYAATTDKATIVNLTQHSYFNLGGASSTVVGDHVLQIAADSYLPVDATLIPTGELSPVEGTPFDFREPKAIGRDIEADNVQMQRGKGYDHCWVLSQKMGDNTMEKAVSTLYHPASGRKMEIFTTEPAIQFYSGNFLDGTLPKPGGGTHGFRSGLCLETQHYPNTPNEEAFPSVTLMPGERYESSTRLKFSSN